MSVRRFFFHVDRGIGITLYSASSLEMSSPFCPTISMVLFLKRAAFDCLDFFVRLLAVPVVFTMLGSERIGRKNASKVSNHARFYPQNEEELVDPQCVEENPHKITFEDITSAAFKIKGGIINTPCVVRSLKGISLDILLPRLVSIQKFHFVEGKETYTSPLMHRKSVPSRFFSVAYADIVAA